LNFITKALPLLTNNERTNKTGTKREVPVRYVDGQKLMCTTARKVNISGYHNEGTLSEGISIGSGVTATDLPTGETILLRANESTILGENGNTLFSVPQLRENGVEVDNEAL
jgi:hypothetical protein